MIQKQTTNRQRYTLKQTTHQQTDIHKQTIHKQAKIYTNKTETDHPQTNWPTTNRPPTNRLRYTLKQTTHKQTDIHKQTTHKQTKIYTNKTETDHIENYFLSEEPRHLQKFATFVTREHSAERRPVPATRMWKAKPLFCVVPLLLIYCTQLWACHFQNCRKWYFQLYFHFSYQSITDLSTNPNPSS